MIVVDTNIIGYLFLSSERSLQAEQVLRSDPQWAAPVLWRSEFRSVLTRYLRKGLLTLSDALQIMNTAVDLLTDREYQVPSYLVLELVSASSCSAYDCEFVALARELKIPLVTIDQHILEQFPDLAISMDEFAGS
jgi:predicted nucleic acid-binding protein